MNGVGGNSGTDYGLYNIDLSLPIDFSDQSKTSAAQTIGRITFGNSTVGKPGKSGVNWPALGISLVIGFVVGWFIFSD